MKKILILTDHRTHSKNDSIFDMAKELGAFFSVWVASRGVKENNEFFVDPVSSSLNARKLNSDFSFDKLSDFFKVSYAADISAFSLVLLRLDSPVSSIFLKSLVDKCGHLPIVNNPDGLLKSRRRDYLLNFSENTLPAVFARTVSEVLEFTAINDAVIKLDDSYGGSGVFRTNLVDKWYLAKHIPIEQLSKIERNIADYGGVFVQKYTENVRKGDKRVLIAFGKVLGGILRTPRDGDWRCNISLGGGWEISPANRREREISIIVSDNLAKLGVYVFGIDFLTSNTGESVVSEINVMNVGGFIQVKSTGLSPSKVLAKTMYDWFCNEVAEKT